MTAVAVVAALFVVFLFYYNVNPESGLMPRCTFKLMTGYDCPGYNPFVFFAVPGALFYIVVESGRRHWPKLHRRATSPRALWGILLVVVCWWIVRNVI